MAEPSHSKFSASAASRWIACPGSIPLSAGKPDSTSSYAAWGTVAHAIADECIAGKWASPAECIGQTQHVDGHQITVDQDMVDCVNTYLANLREMTTGADILTGEMRVNYAEWLNVPREQAWGTADAIAVVGAELQVHDLKTGMGVEVDARDNEQMLLYAGGALLEYQDLADIQTVRMVIHQPRIKQAPSEWSITVDELTAWLRGRARSGAVSVEQAIRMYPDASDGTLPAEWQDTFLHPGEDQCRWCKAKATCPKLRDEVAKTVFNAAPASPDEFSALDTPVEGASAVVAGHSIAAWLGACLTKVDMVEDWCKSIRAEAERTMLAGENVPGFKLVEGKQGNRAWSDEAEALKLLKTFRLKQEEIYDFTVKSPTQIAKLGPPVDKDGNVKPPKEGEEAPVIGRRQWPKIAALITRAPAKKHVAPLSDKRPALEIKPVADEFETQSVSADDLC